MNAVMWGFLLAVVVFVLWMRWQARPDITPAEARSLLEQGAKLIDVRTTGEFLSGHLPKAQNIPLADIGSQAHALGSKDQPLILYCASGMRSRHAAKILKAQGFTRVYNLGAMHNWS